jgi:8-oxo-dGTP pyrophosphatase MutT (NUDIX family)
VEPGVVEEICVARRAGAPMESRSSVTARRGIGLDGDRYAAREGFWRDDRVARDLTLIEAEAAEAVGIAARDARRNVVTRGVDLNALADQTFWLGDLLCLGAELCHPCLHLEEVTGKPVLRPLVGRGGLRARLLVSGTLRVGDSVRPVPAADGVGVIVTRGHRVLVGRRLSPHGLGTWSFPGGKPEPGESPVACALRELHEETGLSGTSATTVGESIDGFPSWDVFHTTFVRVDATAGEPRALEPTKTDRWEWHDWSRLPEPLFAPVASLVGSGYDPFD